MYLLKCFGTQQGKDFQNTHAEKKISPFRPPPSELLRTVLAEVCVIEAMLSELSPLLREPGVLLAMSAVLHYYKHGLQKTMARLLFQFEKQTHMFEENKPSGKTWSTSNFTGLTALRTVWKNSCKIHSVRYKPKLIYLPILMLSHKIAYKEILDIVIFSFLALLSLRSTNPLLSSHIDGSQMFV